MDIVTKPRGELIPYENNPRHNDEAVEYVANSIKEFGWKVPIVIDKNNVVVAGHTRLKAAEMLGIDEIPCIIADDLSEDQIKAYRLADNKVAEKAYWDFSLLDIELDEIELDMSEFGFDDIAIFDDTNGASAANGALEEKFLVPPFSVIQANRGKWMERKKHWLEFGIRSELGRGGELVFQFPEWMERQSQMTRGL